MKPRLLVTFSGGRSSATMTDLLIEKLGDLYELLICFANTGWEHEDTLRFAYACTLRWAEKGHKVVWLECVINQTGIATSHKEVNYFSASRNQEPFIEMVKKFGIPNKGYPHCTRELKEYPIRSYARAYGWVDASYLTCIGIRGDEPQRLSWGYCEGNKQIKIYPLANWFPMTKADVLAYWKDWEHDLRIEEEEGNCLGCFRKSDNKLYRMNQLHPEALQFSEKIEVEFGGVGKNKQGGVYVDEPRQLYRGNRSAGEIIATFKEREQCQKAC